MELKEVDKVTLNDILVEKGKKYKFKKKRLFSQTFIALVEEILISDKEGCLLKVAPTKGGLGTYMNFNAKNYKFKKV